jgi:hypothetical protein
MFLIVGMRTVLQGFSAKNRSRDVFIVLYKNESLLNLGYGSLSAQVLLHQVSRIRISYKG